MPAKVLPTLGDFLNIKDYLLQRGFREMLREEIIEQLRRLEQNAPRKKEGWEAGFIFSANGLSVVVWTTWLEKEGRAREYNAAWVLIIQENKTPYFSHPIHRTKNFVKKLKGFARIAQLRVLNRPRCSKCNEFMKIRRGAGLKARYWACGNIKQHIGGNNAFLDWDFGLPLEAKRWLRLLRKKRRKDREKRRKEGKSVGTALLRRKTRKAAAKKLKRANLPVFICSIS